MGFAGTARRHVAAAAAGLTTLAGHEFGGGTSQPPGTPTLRAQGCRTAKGGTPPRSKRAAYGLSGALVVSALTY